VLIEEEFGCQVSDLFSYLSPEPIAAASLAEVYEGRLKSTNERVAVKMQYIDLQDRFAGDILTIRMILYALGKTFPKFEFSWIFDSVMTSLERELNFKLEGENADRCLAQLSPYLKYIYVPKVYWDYTTERVLVMEYIDGIKVSDLDQIKQSGLSLKEIDTKLVEAMAFQIFHSGFVHADPHVRSSHAPSEPAGDAFVFLAWKRFRSKRSKNTDEIDCSNCSARSRSILRH
jgi:aarF domain-containing kinase